MQYTLTIFICCIATRCKVCAIHNVMRHFKYQMPYEHENGFMEFVWRTLTMLHQNITKLAAYYTSDRFLVASFFSLYHGFIDALHILFVLYRLSSACASGFIPSSSLFINAHFERPKYFWMTRWCKSGIFFFSRTILNRLAHSYACMCVILNLMSEKDYLIHSYIFFPIQMGAFFFNVVLTRVSFHSLLFIAFLFDRNVILNWIFEA